MEVKKVDKLFALKAVEKRVKTEREELEAEVRNDLISQFAESGNDRMRSPYFGNDAGTYTYIPPKDEEMTEWNLADWSKLADWLAKDPKAAEQFIFANFEQFGKWWLEQTGEVPEGIARVTFTTTKPGSTRLAVKDQVVFDKLGGNFLEEVNQLLLEGEYE